MESALISALKDPARYPHDVDDISVMETHISWIILTGSHAYKIKKPLDLGFLDFRELEARRFYCQEELRLNRRLADDVYEAVVPITGGSDRPILGGSGTPFEYALRMRQFDPNRTLDKLCERDELTKEQLDELAERVADFHQSVPALSPEDPLADLSNLRQAMLDNFSTILEKVENDSERNRCASLRGWTESWFDQLEPRIRQRLDAGLFRECHGDLHLGNIASFEGRVTVFDCIEFNESLRWIDPANDLAFLLMDLESRDRRALAYRVLNHYLEQNGDYNALAFMGLYKAYRAMVRAKITLLLPAEDAQARDRIGERFRTYTGLAEHYSRIPAPWLAITTGFSASGKSRISARLAEHFGMIQIRSDVERKRLFNLTPNQSSRSQVDGGIYTPEATRQTYGRLRTLTREALMAGFPVIVDCAALRREERKSLHEVAESLGLPALLVSCEAPEETLRERIRERVRHRNEVSEATEAILEQQFANAEPLLDSEQTHTVHINTDNPESLELLIQAIEKHTV